MTSGASASGSYQYSANPGDRGFDTRGIWKVITASSVGTMIEWYDFYIFGSLAAIISTQFFPGDNPTASFLKTLATFVWDLQFVPLARWCSGASAISSAGSSLS